MTSKFAKFFVRRDIFGQSITVNYKGSEAYRTKLGAFCTIATYVLILINGVALVQGFFDGSKQQESSQTMIYDRFDEGKLWLDESQISIRTATFRPIPPQIGRLRMRQFIGGNDSKLIDLKNCNQEER